MRHGPGHILRRAPGVDSTHLPPESLRAVPVKMSVTIPLKAKLDILPALASVWLTIIYALVVGLFNRRAQTWYLHICYAVVRRLTRRLSPLQMQYVLVLVEN